MDSSQSLLVTGGAGFIGANLVDRALSTGRRVTILDDLSRPGAEENVRWLRERHGESFRLLVRSVADEDACERAVDDADVVYHLAAQVAVTSSVSDPRHDFDVNVRGTFNVLEAIRNSQHRPTLIYASTNKVYGELAHLETVEEETRHAFVDLPNGISEREPLDFHSPYGCSKGAADQYVHDYARIYGLNTVVFRQSCIYGPRQMGVEDQGWVAWFAIAAMTGQPITNYGDGKQVRDLLYNDDLLDAYDMALERIDVTSGKVYNLGGGAENALSIWWEFAPLLEDALGREIPAPTFAPVRAGDQPVFIADTTQYRTDTGWKPVVPVQNGLARLTSWIAENRELFD
ncbi:MAG: NAD-dependent epimerase/dehydratase family protein [Thermomicrobiales bacterium]